MPRRWLLSCSRSLVRVGALVAMAAMAQAAPGDDPDDDDAVVDRGPVQAGAGQVLVGPDASWDVRWIRGPALTAQLAPALLGALEHVRGGAVAPSLYGDGAPPVGWPLAIADPSRDPDPSRGPDPSRDPRRGPDPSPTPAPSRGPGPIGGSDCRTCFPALGPGERIAAVWATTHFALGPDAAALRVLEVRVRYHDGVALWLNGLPLARRELPATGHPLALATRLHGPGWETFFIPVVPGLLRAGDNVLAVHARPAAHTLAPALAVEVSARPAGRIVRGPIVQQVGAETATIVVETDLPTRATLAWGPTAALGTAVDSPDLGRRHELRLTGLPADAAVHYQLTVDGIAAPAAAFATMPGPGEVLRVGIYGDVRGGHRVHAALVARLLDETPDLVVMSGDLVHRGADEADWQQFFAITAPLLATVPYYPAVGNHDLGRAGDLARRFTDLFALPPGPVDRPAGGAWYSFDVGDVHFVMLDSNAYDDATQRAWLEADLTAAAAARAILVVTHDGPFSRGTHGGNQTAVRDYVPILTRHRTTLLVSGHDHLYQRGRQAGLDYLVSGGGGAPLYRIRCGIPGRPRCAHPDGMRHAAREHHYAILTIYPRFLELCPKLVDGSPLEPCVRLPTRR